jgi:hypothetical protein
MAVAFSVLSLVACGEESTESDQPSGGAQAEGQTECSRASRALLDAIATGLEVSGDGSLERGFVVRAKDFEHVYMIAAEIQVPAWRATATSAYGRRTRRAGRALCSLSIR